MPILRASAPEFQPDPPYEPPSESDRMWWANQNLSWHDLDGPPVLEAHVCIGGRYRRVNVDLRPDIYGDPLRPDGAEGHFGI